MVGCTLYLDLYIAGNVLLCEGEHWSSQCGVRDRLSGGNIGIPLQKHWYKAKQRKILVTKWVFPGKTEFNL